MSNNIDLDYTNAIRELKKSTDLSQLFSKHEVPKDIIGNCKY